MDNWSYVAKFNLDTHIKLNSHVIRVDRLPESSQWKHRVNYLDGTDSEDRQEKFYDCSHIAICTGLHVVPNIPTIPGMKNVNGDVFH